MPAFRRVPGSDHIVHAVELPELTRRQRPAPERASESKRANGTSGPGPVGGSNGEEGRARFGPTRDFPGQRPVFGGAAPGRSFEALRRAAAERGEVGRPELPRIAPARPDRLGHGHRPGDGVPLVEAERARPVEAAPVTPPTHKPAASGTLPVAGAPSDSARIEMLERRIAKLARLLEEQSAQLQTRAERQSAEQGVASVYAEVQGLRGDSEEAQRKRELMSSIFDANRKLRERIGSKAPGAE